MPSLVIQRPNAVNFTDNQARYLMTGDFTSPAQKLQVRLFVGSSEPVGIFLYPPTSIGAVLFNVDEIIRPHARFFRPRIDGTYLSQIQEATGHRVRSWIEHRVFDPTSETNPPFTSDVANSQFYIKGGYALWNKVPNFNFEHRRKWFFTWQPMEKLVGEKDNNWLLYCHPLSVQADIEYRVYYTDGTEAVERSAFTPSDVPGDAHLKLYFIPTGVEQCLLKALQPAKQIYRYLVRVLQRDNSTALAEFSYRVDYRPNYDAFVVYFRNSLGGWDSLRVLGEYEESSQYNRRDYQRDIYNNTIPDYNGSGTTPYYRITERRRWDINPGHMDKQEQDALRDLLLSKELATIVRGNWIPLRITNEERNGYNTKNALQNTSISLEEAFENENYTPDKLPWEL